VVFDEKEDAFVSSTGEPAEAVEFPNQTEEPQDERDETEELNEMNAERADSSLGKQDSSKSITQTVCLFSFRHRHLDLSKVKEEAPVDTAGLLVVR
jgi:hypothetical protein